MENALSPVLSKDEDAYAKNKVHNLLKFIKNGLFKIRSAITDFFKERECYTLVRSFIFFSGN